MSILCLWSPDWRTGGESTGQMVSAGGRKGDGKRVSEGTQTRGTETGARTEPAKEWRIEEGISDASEFVSLLLTEAPRVVMESGGVVWVDGRGMDVDRLADRLFERLEASGVKGMRGGVSMVPAVAGAAARTGEKRLTTVQPGEEAHFLAPLPLALLAEEGNQDDERLLMLLDGVGIRRCGELVKLNADVIEIRFGARGMRLWRLARGDDRRSLFRPIPPELPCASVDFVDYSIRDATRLLFVLNSLLDRVCDTLRERARRARSVTLTLTLAGGGRVEEVLRTARPTSDRSFWIRRLRTALEGIRPGDAIVGVALEATQAEGVSAFQGDLFDRGFATAVAVEEAMARLLDAHPGLFVRQIRSEHPLAERRSDWEESVVEEDVSGMTWMDPANGRRSRETRRDSSRDRTAMEMLRGSSARRADAGMRMEGAGGRSGRAEVSRTEIGNTGSQPEALAKEVDAALALQLLPRPRPIHVRTRVRRDHDLPVRLRDGSRWKTVTAAGPHRVSCGHEEERPEAREYFRCVSDDGELLWIYRDATEGKWYLHGWWD